MLTIQSFLDLFIHLDKHMNLLIHDYGTWSYLILFLIIFCETGLVVTPFLPGDSLIFTAGALAATANSPLKVGLLFFLLTMAALSGDSVNYWVGFFMRSKVFRGKKIRFIKKEYIDRTTNFYDRHGGKTIVLARFIPIIRTFAPFVAGLSRMTYWRFLVYSIGGSIAWIAVFIFGGYYVGNLPMVKTNFSIVVFVIVCISVLPAILEFLKQYLVTRNSRLLDDKKSKE